MKVLLTGSSGYIGGRLAPELLARGHHLTCVVRSPGKVQAREWAANPNVKVIQCDIADTDALQAAAADCDVAYYLVHAMEAGNADFAKRDRELAKSFVNAIERTTVKRIIYLGGLGELGKGLSSHLKSRREVGDILRSSNIPVTTFRAAMILGSGSASFEILRYLVERLPIMTTPKWVNTESQPISVIDVLWYLAQSLEIPDTTGKSIEIGGPQVHTYKELMQMMARAIGVRKRIIIPLPVLTPKLSSLWIGLVTPVSPAIARPLAEGLRNRVVVNDPAANELMPHDTIPPAEAIRRGVERVRDKQVPTRWSAAGVIPGDPDWAGGTVFVDERSITVNASPRATYNAVCRVGGGNGWYAADILWRIRGWMDQIMGGPGLRRGRRHPELVEYGEALDFWRVTGIKQDEMLNLRAEMWLPGDAELAFNLEPQGQTTKLNMRARFRPRGLLGLAYWYAVLPFHAFVFSGMLKGMKRSAENGPSEQDSVDKLRGSGPPPRS